MKKIKFGMQTVDGVIQTDGYLLELYDWIKLVVHRAQIGKGWTVSEFSTGAAFTGCIALRTEAILAGKAAIESIGKDEMLRRINLFIEKNTPKPVAPPRPSTPPSGRLWPKEGQIVHIRYGKRYMETYSPPYQCRHARVLIIASGRPKNCLCMLRGGKRVVVNIGNLFIP